VAGSKETWQRASDKAKNIIAGHDRKLPDAIRKEILEKIKGIVD
jgi:hypothetical protein